MKATAIIVAGGSGVRMKAPVRKQYLNLLGRPILQHTLHIFNASQQIDKIFLVVPEEDFDFCIARIVPEEHLGKRVILVAGGPERQDSVLNGLRAAESAGDIVLIHDGVRPFVTQDQIQACIEVAETSGACILGVPAVDTLKRVDSDTWIAETLDRQTIWMAQTPQAFRYHLIRQAHEVAKANGILGTDDASLVEATGHSVQIVPGSPWNIKITTSEDFDLAAAIIQMQLQI